MTDDQFYNSPIFKNHLGSALVPENQAAKELLDSLKNDEKITVKAYKPRDLKLHRCYFIFLMEVRGYLPKVLREKIPEDKFYIWLKHFMGQYEVAYEFKELPPMITYHSISFGKMDDLQFKKYVKDQIPGIYEILRIALKNDTKAEAAIETIEENFEKMFKRL